MNTGIEVDVFYLKDKDDCVTQELGIEVDFSHCILKKYKLYNIDYITKYDDEKCVISSAGLDFIVNESYDSVSLRIEQSRTYRLN